MTRRARSARAQGRPLGGSRMSRVSWSRGVVSMAVASVVSFAVGAVGAVSGCAGDDDLGGPTASGVASGVTVPVATLPPIAPTVATTAAATPTTGVPATTTPATVAPTTAPPTTAAPSTTVATTTRPTTTVPAAPAAPCDLDLIVEQTQTAYEGITPADLGCADGWAAWIGRPDDQFADGFFAVARWDGSTWALVNLGTAGICADAGVPSAIWDELGCFE